CMTINDHWGYSEADRNHKSTRNLVHILARSASAGANYLLNVGPTPQGEILPVHAERLAGVGDWLKINGESIYETRAGVVPPSSSVVSTRSGDTHYIHVLDYISDCVALKGLPDTIHEARILHNNEVIDLEQRDGAWVVTIPPAARDPLNTVVVLS
ncbi:MAG: alpha-L-fucosidase, partial [Anaerolineae bacterium]|nr:alpha-L-fucosidase [Anaerolineae bacterium]